MKTLSLFLVIVTSSVFAAGVGPGPAEKSESYRLVEGAALIDDCGPCGRPTLMIPIDGAFQLVTADPEPWYQVFEIRDFHFVGIWGEYTGRLKGTYKIGGDFVLDHRMTLEGRINDRPIVLQGQGFPRPGLPWIIIDLKQIKPDPEETPMQIFSLQVVATAWPGQLQFSTEVPFTSGNKLVGKVSDGDLLNTAGRVVRRNQQLTRRLGIMPIVPDLGLDAVMRAAVNSDDLAPQDNVSASVADFCPCEKWFSLEEDVWSETLGKLYEGDILGERGRVVRRYRDLIGAFGPMPPVPDAGLDAVCAHDSGTILFSTERDFFSERLGRTIHHGDLLSEKGNVYKTIKDLLVNFTPVDPIPREFGLDAVILRPNPSGPFANEIWFSTEEGFTDTYLGEISDGDLLSTNGRIVMKNLRLLRQFRPLEKLGNFGLDAADFIAPQPVGDLDDDCDVQFDDFAEFAHEWDRKDCGECGGADFAPNGIVDLKDLMIFADHWLMGASRPDLVYKVGDCGGLTDPTDKFSVKVHGRYVFFEDKFRANCCAKAIELSMGVSGNEVNLTEIEIPGAPCDCICDYPIRAILGPFEPGVYKLNLYHQYEGGTTYVGSVTFVIGTIVPSLEYSVGSCGGAEPPDPSRPRFSVDVNGRFIHFKDSIYANCCADKIELEMKINNNEITLNENIFVSHPCRCLCNWQTTARMGPFVPGTYILAVFQNELGQTDMIGTVKVTVE